MVVDVMLLLELAELMKIPRLVSAPSVEMVASEIVLLELD